MQIDVCKVLDEGRWTAYQKFLVACTALAIILDGLDIQLLSPAVAAMGKEWGLAQPAFLTALGISGLGMLLGGVACGWLSDRFGRRWVLALSLFSFAVFTLSCAAVHGVESLTLLRFLSGLGLGGALPTSAALASEYVPRRRRAMAVTCTIVCVPLGAMLAGVISGYVVPAFGWRALFLVGGAFPILVGLLIVIFLPESPRYLARHKTRWPDLIRLLGKFGHALDADASFVDSESGHAERGRSAFLRLFSREYVGDTLALFASFFFGLLVNYMAFTKLHPTLMGVGFTQKGASDALTWWNVGGVAGALFGGVLIQWFGSRITMLGLSVISVASAFGLAHMHLDPAHTFGFTIMCILLGGTLNAVQTTMYALAAHVYPSHFRGTGIGTAVAVGRIGATLAPFASQLAITRGGISDYFAVYGFGMIAVFISLALVRRHIERSAPQQAPEEAIAVAGE